MKKIRLHHHQRNTGAYAGGPGQSYAAFRYGERNPRSVYIPGKPQQPIFKNRDQRQHMLSLAVHQLQEWQLSPFQHEGAVRAGLRSELCLKSFRWNVADQAAAALVAEALAKMGAKRPSWDEGQRHYVEPRENCAWCQAPLPDDMAQGEFRKRFCSEVCARSALQHWDFESRSLYDRTMEAARESIRRLRNAPKPCGHCQKPFRARGGNKGIFCSAECQSASRRTIYERPCQHCGKLFAPVTETKGRGKFCSPKCHYAHGRAKALAECKFCGVGFETASKYAKYCCDACRQVDIKLMRGGQVKKLRPHVFDHFLTVPVNAARPAWLTPERFDQMAA